MVVVLKVKIPNGAGMSNNRETLIKLLNSVNS